jgi:hypothetical protein
MCEAQFFVLPKARKLEIRPNFFFFWDGGSPWAYFFAGEGRLETTSRSCARLRKSHAEGSLQHFRQYAAALVAMFASSWQTSLPKPWQFNRGNDN